MSGSGRGKVSQRLTERLASLDPNRPVDVVVELAPVPLPTFGSRAERVQALREEFEREAAPVAEKISAIGGEVLGSAWVNQTVRGRVPAGEVGRLADEVVVRAVDLPSPLEPDT